MRQKKEYRFFKGVTFLLISLLISHFSLFLSGCSNAQSQVSDDLEILLGSLTTKIFLEIMPAYDDPGWQNYLRSIGVPITRVCERPLFDYRFVVTQSSRPNAFASPDGTIFVTTGLIRALEYKKDAIAAVLAHEIGHIALRHGRSRLAKELGWWAALSALFGVDQPAARVAGNIAGAMQPLGYGRNLELEADSAGLRYLQKLHYPPDTMKKLLIKIEEIEKSREAPVVACLSTHPSGKERLEHILGTALLK